MLGTKLSTHELLQDIVDPNHNKKVAAENGLTSLNVQRNTASTEGLIFPWATTLLRSERKTSHSTLFNCGVSAMLSPSSLNSLFWGNKNNTQEITPGRGLVAHI
jgi:hypothetical protein